MRILIVEDEVDLAETLQTGLRREGYDVESAYDGRQALTRLANEDFDILILDRDLPFVKGDTVCSILRTEGHPIRILMLTAAGSLDDRITGLDLGADDYLAKPFAYLELMARLRALGRRITRSSAATIEIGGVTIDPQKHIALRHEEDLRLTLKEYEVLEFLFLADGGYVSAEQLLDEIWGDSEARSRNVVKTTIHTLRKKVGEPSIIEAAAGLGYRAIA